MNSQRDQVQLPLLVSILIVVVMLPVGGLILDRILGDGLNKFLEESPNALLIIFLAGFGLSLVLQTYVFNRWRSTDKKIDQLTDFVGRSATARVVRYAEGYNQLAKWVREAEESVLILNYSPDGGYESGIQHIPIAVREPLFRDYKIPILNTDVRFERIIQLNGGVKQLGSLWLNLEENKDQLTYEQCVLLAKLQADDPAKKSFIRVSPVFIHSTFALVDSTKLFLRLDYKRPDKNIYDHALILLVEDQSREAFRELIHNYRRISDNNHTKKVTPPEVEQRNDTNIPT